MDLYFATKFWGSIILFGLLVIIMFALFISAIIENKRRKRK